MGSARFPQFSRPALERSCAEVGITYEWHGQHLGGKFVNGGVEANLQSPEGSAALASLAERSRSGEAIALMCSEVDWKSCHRACLARELVARHGCKVLHLSGVKVECHPAGILSFFQKGSKRPPESSSVAAGTPASPICKFGKV